MYEFYNSPLMLLFLVLSSQPQCLQLAVHYSNPVYRVALVAIICWAAPDAFLASSRGAVYYAENSLGETDRHR